MKLKLITLTIICLFSVNVLSADENNNEDVSLSTIKQKFSYTMGMRFAGGMLHERLDVDLDSLKLGIEDAFNGTYDRLSKEDMTTAVQIYKEKQAGKNLDGSSGEKNKIEGEKFLAVNKDKEGVKVTDTGLQYKVLKKGKGKKPNLTDTVIVNYRGTFINGEEFDSSYTRGEPATFMLNSVIAGWKEALQKMEEGAKWQVVIPYFLAYGEKGMKPKVDPFTTLVFEIELLGIKSN